MLLEESAKKFLRNFISHTNLRKYDELDFIVSTLININVRLMLINVRTQKRISYPISSSNENRIFEH